MKLRGSITTFEDFEVSEDKIIDAYVKIVRDQAGFRYDWYLKEDNFIYFDEDCYTSHRWTDTVKVRAATPEEIVIFNHIELVRKMQYEKRKA